MITYLTKLPWRVFRGGIVMTTLAAFHTVRSIPKVAKKSTSAIKAFEPWGILIAVIALVMTAIDFEEDRTARAWQLLASDAPGNSGKIWALEYLGRARHCADWIPGFGLLPEEWQDAVSDRECPPREPLHGVDLSPRENDGRAYTPRTYLRGVRLEGSDQTAAIFERADLTSADLSRANLFTTTFADANLDNADFTGARFGAVDFNGAFFRMTNLSNTRGSYAGTPHPGSLAIECEHNPAGILPAFSLQDPRINIVTVMCDDELNPLLDADGNYIVAPDESAE